MIKDILSENEHHPTAFQIYHEGTMHKAIFVKSGPRLPQLEKALAQKRRPNTAKNK